MRRRAPRLAATIGGLFLAMQAMGAGTTLRAEHWPRFRGPSGQGLSAERDLPVDWSATRGVSWRTPIPGLGWSSPIVWGDRVFVTTTTNDGRDCHVLALDRRSGAILWDRLVFTQKTSRKEAKNSYATPTPATDGERVYATFADGSFVALTLDGRVVWTNRDVAFYGQHGLGASLLVHEELLITARDGSDDVDKGLGWQTPWDKGFVIALDVRTGRERWRSGRGASRIAHATPIVIEAQQRGAAPVDGKPTRSQLVSNAGDVVQVFDAATGRRLHSIESRGEGAVPSPVIAGDLIVTVSGFGAPAVRAMRPDALAPLVWEQTSGVPMQSSPIHVAPYLYLVTDNGVLTALRAATGEAAWRHRLGGTFSASPVAAGGRLYLLNEECQTVVVTPGDVYAEVSRNALPGRCQASMAVSGGLLLIRTDTELYAIGRAEAAK